MLQQTQTWHFLKKLKMCHPNLKTQQQNIQHKTCKRTSPIVLPWLRKLWKKRNPVKRHVYVAELMQCSSPVTQPLTDKSAANRNPSILDLRFSNCSRDWCIVETSRLAFLLSSRLKMWMLSLQVVVASVLLQVSNVGNGNSCWQFKDFFFFKFICTAFTSTRERV